MTHKEQIIKEYKRQLSALEKLKAKEEAKDGGGDYRKLEIIADEIEEVAAVICHLME